MNTTDHQCPGCGSYSAHRLADGWMRCHCGQEFNHAAQRAEEAERAVLAASLASGHSKGCSSGFFRKKHLGAAQ